MFVFELSLIVVALSFLIALIFLRASSESLKKVQARYEGIRAFTKTIEFHLKDVQSQFVLRKIMPRKVEQRRIHLISTILRDANKRLDVAAELLHSGWGGNVAQAWNILSADYLSNENCFNSVVYLGKEEKKQVAVLADEMQEVVIQMVDALENYLERQSDKEIATEFFNDFGISTNGNLTEEEEQVEPLFYKPFQEEEQNDERHAVNA